MPLNASTPRTYTSARPPISVAILDEDFAIGCCIGQFLTTQREIKIDLIAVASSLSEYQKLVDSRHPDVVLFDTTNSECLPLTVASSLATISKHSRLLAFTRTRSNVLNLGLKNAGVHGVAHRSGTLEDLLIALVMVSSGKTFFPGLPQSLEKGSTYTARELQVVDLLAQGLSTIEISKRLSIGKKTVDKFRQKLMNKSGVHDAVSLTRYALRNGMAYL